MTPRSGVFFMEKVEVDALTRESNDAGCATFVLPAHGIADKSSFFDAVRATLPLDPPVISKWDALADSLWEGLSDQPEQCILIVWPNAQLLADAAPDVYDTARSIFLQVVPELADPAATVGNPKQVSVIIEVGKPVCTGSA